MGFYSADLNIDLIGYKFVRGLIVIGIYKGADDDSGCFGIVIDHSMGDLDPMDVFESLYSLPEGELEVHPVREAQPHDIGIVLLISERGCPFGELTQVHVEKVDGELPVKITEFVFPVFRRREIPGQFFQITQIVKTVVIDAFMDTEVSAVFDRLE